VSAFHPDFKMTDVPRTPPETLHRAHAHGKNAGLNFVYSGNIPGDKFEHTLCPGCGKKLIDRIGFHVNAYRLVDGACPDCSTRIPGVQM